MNEISLIEQWLNNNYNVIRAWNPKYYQDRIWFDLDCESVAIYGDILLRYGSILCSIWPDEEHDNPSDDFIGLGTIEDPQIFNRIKTEIDKACKKSKHTVS